MTAPVGAGRCAPLGATVRDGGVNFAVFSAHATRVELCLFGADGVTEHSRHTLAGPVDDVFCGFLPNAGEGLVYGFRVHGPYAPERGHRFNPSKVLLDPHARRIVGRFESVQMHHGYQWGHGPTSMDCSDNAPNALKAQVIADPALPGAGRPPRPRHLPANMVLYEVHVKGFTRQMPLVPSELQGRFAGMAHPSVIAHLKSIGVTTVSLLPVQQSLSEPALLERGASNYWGYNTIGFFCADPRLASEQAQSAIHGVRDEFCAMVDALHVAGIEVVLDVVYNHTPEGNEFGPTLCWRGLDHASYYRLQRHDLSQCENLTGCGNTLQVSHPRVAQFVLDSLRHWVTHMGVDGFRFDLAPVLGRTDQGFDVNAAFFTALRQDPELADVHLISEPWDAGPGGYQVGRFPGRFMDWNDKFRDTVRGYWLQKGVDRAEFARRFTASSDLFDPVHKRPWASVNFVSVHDGFCLNDLVSYSTKHNLANGEDNRDGRDGELCHNFGVEGPSADAHVRAVRLRVQRALLATLILAQGTPMICAGDEFGNSQQGNNNAYCQDNPITWLNWAQADGTLIDWVKQLTTLRREHALLRWDHWFDDRIGGHVHASLTWTTPSGEPMHVRDWHDGVQTAFAGALRPPSTQVSPQDRALAPELVLIFNPHASDQQFVLPCSQAVLLADSSGSWSPGCVFASELLAPARSFLVLKVVNESSSHTHLSQP